MTGEVALYALMLLLPVAALIARRLPISETLKIAAVWIGVFALLYLAVVAWQQVTGDAPAVRASSATQS